MVCCSEFDSFHCNGVLAQSGSVPSDSSDFSWAKALHSIFDGEKHSHDPGYLSIPS